MKSVLKSATFMNYTLISKELEWFTDKVMKMHELITIFGLLIILAMTGKFYVVEKMFEEQRREHDYKYDSSWIFGNGFG